MVFNVLTRLKHGNKIRSCAITVSNPGAINGRNFVFGRDIVNFNKSAIRFRGGETGYEEFTVPLDDVISVESGGKIIFRKRPKIDKVYPR